jgi:hypothetical protein
LHWAREKSTDQLDALARHLTELGYDLSLDEQIELLNAIVWRGSAQLQLKLEERQQHQALILFQERLGEVFDGEK